MRTSKIGVCVLLLCSVIGESRAEIGSEIGVWGGGALATGPVNDFNPSLHGGLSMGVGFGRGVLGGIEFAADTQHVSKTHPVDGLPERYDAKMNLGHAGIWAKYPVQVLDYIELTPIAGLGWYQVNTFERHAHFDGTGKYLGHTAPFPLVDSTNYLGVSVGVQTLLNLGPSLAAGPAVRYHLLMGNGRYDLPSFVTIAFFAAIRI